MATSLLQWLLSTDYKDKGVRDAKKDLKDLGDQVKGGISQLTGFNLTGLTVIGMVAGLAAGVKKAADYFVEYSDQVRQASNLSGMSAEETSRLIQVSDDYGISADKLTTILTGANKAGFQPTIENLANLSDQFLAMESPLEQNRLLTEKLGKTGLDYIDVMKLGGAAIREKAAAVEDGMVLDEKALKKSLEYKQAVDSLEDAFNALKIQLAEGVVPALTAFLNGVSKVFTAERDAKRATEEQTKATVAATESYADYKKRIEEQVAVRQEAIGADKEQMAAAYGVSYAVEAGAGATDMLTEAEFNLIKAQYGLNDMVNQGIPYLGALGNAMETNTQTTADYTDELKALKDTIGGPVGKELDNYAEKMAKINEETEATKTKIGELEAIKHPTKDQQADLEEARQKLEDLGDEATTAAEEHHQAMGKIIYDMAAVRAAADGVITESEYNALKTYAEKMGLVDQATVDAQYALQLMDDTVKASPGSADNYARALQVMTERLDDGTLSAQDLKDILDTLKGTAWNVSVSTDVDASELDDLEERIRRGYRIPVTVGTGTTAIAMAEGGEGVVTTPTLFVAGEAGAEHFSFTPLENGHGAPAGGGVTINMYGSINNGMDLEEFAQYVTRRMGAR